MIRVDMAFPKEFVDLYNKFNYTQKGKEYLELSGISRNKLDIATISKDYFENNTSDVSVDPNANVGQRKSLNTFTSEITKGLLKLDGYFLLWKYLERLYGIEDANNLISGCISGKYYPHDLTKINVPYCVAVSTFNIMIKGRPYGTLYSKPPKRSSSFIAQCIEHLMSMSQEFAGAVAFGDLLVNYAWYINKEFEGLLEDDEELKSRNKMCRDDLLKNIESKIENDFQSFTHVANNNFRIGGDSPFSNVSLYCRQTLKNMFEHYRYPDGSSPLDITNTIMKIQSIFMRFISKKDPIDNLPYRFPITTISLFVDGETRDIGDFEFLEDIAEHNSEGVFNIFITNDKARIASCCFSGDEYIYVRNDCGCFKEYKIKDFINIFLRNENGKRIISGWYIKDINGKEQEITGVLCKNNEHNELIEINIDDNIIRVTPDHQFKVFDTLKNIEKDVSASVLLSDKDRYLLPVKDNE